MKSIILLSGGLDSLVSLGLLKDSHNVELALTFDYGQKSAESEIEASKKICSHYNLKHKVIKLDWLKDITTTALVSKEDVPQGEHLDDSVQSAKSVWVPNRNGLFLNIAASFADSEDYDYIIIGANKEEGETFPDNSADFIEKMNEVFKFSTMKKPQIVTPLLYSDKNDIVKKALGNDIPLEYVRSCYQTNPKNCGVCESCTRLMNALKYNNSEHYLKELF